MHSLQNSKNTHSLKQMLDSDALMLQNGKQKLQKLNKTTTVVSAYTLRLKIAHTSNDVIWSNQLYIILVSSECQNGHKILH